MRGLSFLVLVGLISALAAEADTSSYNLGFEDAELGQSNLVPLDGSARPEVFVPACWARRSNNTVMESYVLRDEDFTCPEFPSEGDKFLYLFSSNYESARLPGQFVEEYIEADLTGVRTMTFTAGRRSVASDLDERVESYLRIGSVKVWSINTSLGIEEISIDVSGFTGITEIAFGVVITEEHQTSRRVGGLGLTYIDDVRFTPPLPPPPAPQEIPVLTVAPLDSDWFRISWPLAFRDWALQQSDNLSAGSWVLASELTVEEEGDELVVYAPISATARAYRLRGP